MKMAYDFSKLLGKITEKFKTQTRFAQAMGWSERTNSIKLNGFVDWKQSDILRACEILEIGLEEIPTYFFTVNVQY